MDTGSFQNGVQWKKNDDGSLTLTCSRCFEEWTCKPDNAMYSMYRDNSTTIQTNLCINCWKTEKEETRAIKEINIQDRIIRGQAMNMATWSLITAKNWGTEEYWSEWIKRVEVFANKIIEKQA